MSSFSSNILGSPAKRKKSIYAPLKEGKKDEETL